MYSFSEPSPLNVFIYNLTRNWNVNEDDLVNDPMGDEIYNLTRNWNVNNVGTTL